MAIKKEITIAARDKAIKILSALPPKTPATEPIEDALKAMKPAIESLLDNGYTREEVIEKLGQAGVQVKMYQLKSLLSKGRKVKDE